MLKFTVFFLFVCFAIWGILYFGKQMTSSPELAIQAIKKIAIGITIAVIASICILFFVSVF